MIYYFNINYACNNKCIFCAADISGQTIGEEISINNFKKILEERNVAKGDTVIINGGEPTIHKDFFLFLEEINKRSAKIDLFTNGIKLCDENFAKQVLKFEPLLIRIPVFGKNASSHDMLTGKIGNFNKILKAIDIIINEQQKNHLTQSTLEIKLLLSKATAYDNEDILDLFIKKYGPNSCVFSINPLLVSKQVVKEKAIVFEKYSKLMPTVYSLMKKAKEKKCVLKTALLPICLFDNEHQQNLEYIHIKPLSYYHDPNVCKKEVTHLSSAKCVECVYNKSCSGFPESYLQFAGESEVLPIKK